MMVIDSKLTFGQIVYLKTDPEQHERMVTAIIVKKNEILYELSFSDSCTAHHYMEISEKKEIKIN